VANALRTGWNSLRDRNLLGRAQPDRRRSGLPRAASFSSPPAAGTAANPANAVAGSLKPQSFAGGQCEGLVLLPDSSRASTGKSALRQLCSGSANGLFTPSRHGQPPPPTHATLMVSIACWHSCGRSTRPQQKAQSLDEEMQWYAEFRGVHQQTTADLMKLRAEHQSLLVQLQMLPEKLIENCIAATRAIPAIHRRRRCAQRGV